MITFTVWGEAVPKQSFRVSGKGGYRDPKVTAWQAQVKAVASCELINWDGPSPKPLTCPVKVYLEFFLSNRRRVDLDNLSKAVLDGMNGIVFKDDTQVHELHIVRKLDTDPHVNVKVEEL